MDSRRQVRWRSERRTVRDDPLVREALALPQQLPFLFLHGVHDHLRALVTLLASDGLNPAASRPLLKRAWNVCQRFVASDSDAGRDTRIVRTPTEYLASEGLRNDFLISASALVQPHCFAFAPSTMRRPSSRSVR